MTHSEKVERFVIIPLSILALALWTPYLQALLWWLP